MQTMHFSSYAVKEKYHTYRKMLKTMFQIRQESHKNCLNEKIDNAKCHVIQFYFYGTTLLTLILKKTSQDMSMKNSLFLNSVEVRL